MDEVRGTVLERLLAQCEQLPVPDGRWHPHADAIVAVRTDFEHALQVVRGASAALEAIGQLRDEPTPQLEASGGPHLQAAWARLERLAVPAGRHPFLDEITDAVETARIVLVAVGRDPVAARRFELAAVSVSEAA